MAGDQDNYRGVRKTMSNEDNPATAHLSPFEAIRRESEDGSEYWSARDLARILGYTQPLKRPRRHARTVGKPSQIILLLSAK